MVALKEGKGLPLPHRAISSSPPSPSSSSWSRRIPPPLLLPFLLFLLQRLASSLSPFPPLVFHLAGAPLEPANHHRIPYNDQRNKKEEK